MHTWKEISHKKVIQDELDTSKNARAHTHTHTHTHTLLSFFLSFFLFFFLSFFLSFWSITISAFLTWVFVSWLIFDVKNNLFCHIKRSTCIKANNSTKITMRSLIQKFYSHHYKSVDPSWLYPLIASLFFKFKRCTK